MKTKICFAITSRADYSLALPIINQFKKTKKYKIFTVSSGYLSSRKYENKITIVKKKLKIDKEIKNFPLQDTSLHITKALGIGIIEFAIYFKKIKPKYVFVFADKYEMLAPTLAAVQLDAIICHVEGGDITHGAIDDNIRHAITKLSHYHFCSTSSYKKRLVQLGEHKSRILVSGCPSLELIKKQSLDNKYFYNKYKVKLNKEFVLSTFHPVTHELKNTRKYIKNLIYALKKTRIQIIFTSPNADLSRDIIVKEIKKETKKNKLIKYLERIEYEDYFKLLNNCKIIIGNSSSGIIESPSFSKISINIGSRQLGRIFSNNIIQCGYSCSQISNAIKKALTVNKKKIRFKNPYLNGIASKKIYNFISKKNKKNNKVKKFINLKFNG
jgi:GDP/UDP-N,N'-diacetylbacillosamine 2-epimerase (hydrolysing)